jgi:hypothetical protein
LVGADPGFGVPGALLDARFGPEFVSDVLKCLSLETLGVRGYFSEIVSVESAPPGFFPLCRNATILTHQYRSRLVRK